MIDVDFLSDLEQHEGHSCQCKNVCKRSTYTPRLSYSEIDPENFKKYILTDDQKEKYLKVSPLLFHNKDQDKEK